MCIAICKAEGIKIFENVLERCFDANPDGAGFAVIEDEKVVIKKGYFKFDEFMDAFLPYQSHQALIHFRIRTHGDINEDNCHPFYVNDELAFIHNGIIFKHGNTGQSDTRDFNDTMIIPLVEKYGKDILNTPQIKKMIEEYIGNSKIVFLDSKTKEFTIFNEQMGKWDSGVWFSNTSYQEKKVWTPPPPVPYNKHGSWGTKKRFEAYQSAHEVPFMMKYIQGKEPLKIERDDLLKAVDKGTGDLIIGDIYQIDNLYSDYTADVFGMGDATFHKGISIASLGIPSDEDMEGFKYV